MKKCKNCGAQVLVDHYGFMILKCPKCGQPLTTKEEIAQSLGGS